MLQLISSKMISLYCASWSFDGINYFLMGLNTFSPANFYPFPVLPLRADVVYFGFGRHDGTFLSFSAQSGHKRSGVVRGSYIPQVRHGSGWQKK